MEKAVLFSEMTPAPDWEGKFNAWYDDEHIPLRMRVPGFAGAQRYKRNARDYLAVYDMDEPRVLDSEAYKNVKDNPSDTTAWMLKSVGNFTRYIGNPIAFHAQSGGAGFLTAPVLYPVFFTVPENRLAEFDDWYDQDHAPTLLETPDWLAVRRFDVVSGGPEKFNRLALHYLADRRALESDARTKARESGWRDRLSQEDWFKGTYMVFDRHGDRFTPDA